MSFGETLKRFREDRGMNKRALELATGVPSSNITQMERGTRGVPEVSTLLSLSSALNLTRVERKELIEAAMTDYFRTSLERFAVYYFLLLADHREVRALIDTLQKSARDNPSLRKFLGEKGAKLDNAAARDLYIALAHMPELAHLREGFAPDVIERLTIDLAEGLIQVRLGQVAQDLVNGVAAESTDRSSASV